MKLTIRWSDREEAGVLSKAEVAALKCADRTLVLDFLQDAAYETEKLYHEMIEAVPGGTVCQSREHAKPKPTTNDAQSD